MNKDKVILKLFKEIKTISEYNYTEWENFTHRSLFEKGEIEITHAYQKRIGDDERKVVYIVMGEFRDKKFLDEDMYTDFSDYFGMLYVYDKVENKNIVHTTFKSYDYNSTILFKDEAELQNNTISDGLSKILTYVYDIDALL